MKLYQAIENFIAGQLSIAWSHDKSHESVRAPLVKYFALLTAEA